MYERNINRQLTKSTTPIFLPDKTKYSNQSFEIYRNWVDAYVIRSSSGDGTLGAYYIQLSPASHMSADSEGYSQDEVDMFLSVRDMSDCEKHDEKVDICTIPAAEHKSFNLKRKVSERRFARYSAEPASKTVLIAELTTKAFKEGYKIKDGVEYLNYTPISEAEQNIILNTLKSTKLQPLAQAKNLFNPQY